jgi:GH3 auxin-responsive promoter
MHSEQLAQHVLGSRAAFLELTGDAARQQTQCLISLLQRNRTTKIGQQYAFSQIASVADFQSTVPVTTYQQIASDIQATAAGEEDLLFAGSALVMEPTGGSGASNRSGLKLIAYSGQSLVEFQNMVRPWLDDLFQTYPELISCSAYWSISPTNREALPLLINGPIPIGLPTDAHYLGDALGDALFRSLSVPPSVGSITDHNQWALATLCHLLNDENLGLVSVWSPTFWLDLTTIAVQRSSDVLAAFESHHIAISAERRLMLNEQLPLANFVEIWPKLKVISCWADASAQVYIPALQRRFPHCLVQGKGLLATEGAMSFPLMVDRNNYQHVLALNSGFFEFAPLGQTAESNGNLKLCHELDIGAQYRIFLTNSSGLYRYDIGDEIEVTGFLGTAPCFKFLGRGASTVDLCGEKLSESFVGQAIAGALLESNLSCCAVLTPVAQVTLARGYQLVIDQVLSSLQTQRLASALDSALSANPQYAYARKLGQLQSIQLVYLANLQQRWLQRALAKGQQLGDIKPPVLTQDNDWLNNDSNIFYALSTPRYELSLAGAADDEGLKRRMAADIMRGSIDISFRREPSYFSASHIQGDKVDVIQCKSVRTGHIVGLSCRAQTWLNLQGKPTRFGYLADLRGEPSVRGGTLLARGIKALQILQDREPIEQHFCVIFEGNREIEKLLTSKRVGLPVFERVTRVLTPAIMLGRPKPLIKVPQLHFRIATQADLAAIAEFLQRELAHKNYSPFISLEELESGKFKSIRAENYYLAINQKTIVACVAAWDQSAYRQTHVEAYHGALRLAKPFINIAAGIANAFGMQANGIRKLPHAGQPIGFVYIALAAAEENNFTYFEALLRFTYNQLCASNYHYMFTSLCEDDVLSKATAPYKHIPAAGVVYRVNFHGQKLIASDSNKINYIEAACL